jgi:predicted O-methyltransferase YrrM
MDFRTQYLIRSRSVSDIWEHLPFLRDTTLGYPAPRVVELGVRTGNSTAAFLAAIEERGAGHVWSVDITTPRVPPWWLGSPWWTLRVGDDRDPAIRDAVAGDCGAADIVFIDSSHEYGHTLAELESWFPLLRPGGVALLHDTEWSGRDVARALDAFCGERNLTWVNRPGCNGMGVIRKGG